MFRDKWMAFFIAMILAMPLLCFTAALFKSDLAGFVKYNKTSTQTGRK